MDITSLGNTNFTSADPTRRNPSSELGRDAFLKILVSQLQNQDPLSPMEDRDFVAQMAQFSTLEQMQNLNMGNNFGQATALIGKNILAGTNDASGMPQTLEGVVTSVFAREGVTYLEVGGYSVPYDQKIVVFDNSSIET